MAFSSSEDKDVLNTHIKITELLKRERKLKIVYSKIEDVYIDYRFIFGSKVRTERYWIHCNFNLNKNS